ncbi:MAG: TetR/AcrR family transcriptional regulator [Myxococcota bacterium]|nr:TetR/AcrR family transcriptional regulator [Myxococcota bacterium]
MSSLPSSPERAQDALGQRILAAASALLSERGAEGLSVRGIAERAGTSTMGVYSRFGGKHGVVDALFREGFERLHRETAPLAGSDGSLEAIVASSLAYRRTALAHATHYEIMFGRAVPGFEPSTEARAAASASFEHVVVEAVRRAVDAGLLQGDPFEIGFRLWSLVHGMVSLELNGAVPAVSEAAGERRHLRAVRAYLDGMRPPGC